MKAGADINRRRLLKGLAAIMARPALPAGVPFSATGDAAALVPRALCLPVVEFLSDLSIGYQPLREKVRAQENIDSYLYNRWLADDAGCSAPPILKGIDLRALFTDPAGRAQLRDAYVNEPGISEEVRLANEESWQVAEHEIEEVLARHGGNTAHEILAGIGRRADADFADFLRDGIPSDFELTRAYQRSDLEKLRSLGERASPHLHRAVDDWMPEAASPSLRQKEATGMADESDFSSYGGSANGRFVEPWRGCARPGSVVAEASVQPPLALPVAVER